MDALQQNITSSAQRSFDDQKAAVQEQAQLGQTAAAIAAKAPVDPQTVIQGVLLWRRIQGYMVPAAALAISVVAAAVTYRMWFASEKDEARMAI